MRLHEPRLALDGGDDGLIYYRKIADEVKNLAKDSFLLAVEIGYNQGSEVKEIFEDTKLFSEVEIIKDLANLDRVVVAYCNINK